MTEVDNTETDARLLIRPMTVEDIDDVRELQERCFADISPWSVENLREHLRTFPAGQICIELDGEVVGSSSSLILDSKDYDDEHTFREIVPGGFLRNHNTDGNILYGIDIVVSPDTRGMRLARRLYEARKQLVRELNLRKMVIAGRMPGYDAHNSTLTPDEYLTKVVAKELTDPVLTTQLANGFVVLEVLDAYLPADKESRGRAVLMEWLNPLYIPRNRRRRAKRIRVAAVQYQMRAITSFEEFEQQAEFFVDTASEYRANFLLFPELLTNQLLGLLPPDRPGVSARMLDRFTGPYVDFFSRMAIRYNVNIVGGTHLTVQDDTLFNIAYLFQRDGRIGQQKKIHITPSERRWWGVAPGDDVEVFDTDSGKIAIAICYDVEFPELARVARDKGAEVLFVPYNTDLRSGHIRVRTCAHARCIENHMYAVLSGAIGNLPFVDGADIHFAQSCILTPSDVPFDRDGIAIETTPNVEAMLVHELDLEKLRRTERTGTVRTWGDRRGDLYELKWGDHTVRGPMPDAD